MIHNITLHPSNGPLLFCFSSFGILGYLNYQRIWRKKQSSKKVIHSSPTADFNTSNEVPTISEEQLNFYEAWTGSRDMKHIIASWLNVKSKFHTYRCIQSMMYLSPRSKQLHNYPEILDHFAVHQSIKIADVGCCFGQDIRNLILEGIPPSSIFAIDIHDGYWNAGLELFKDNLSNKLTSVQKCFFDVSLPMHHITAIESLQADIFNSFDFIMMQAVLHTMSREQQVGSLSRVFNLLKRGSGKVMGTTVGAEEATTWALTPDGQGQRFLNNPQSLSILLKTIGFTHISIRQREVGSGRQSDDDMMRNRIYLEFTATCGLIN